MIDNPDWNQPEERAYFHQISQDCIEKLTECMEGIDTDEIDCDTCLKMQEILSDEIDNPEFLEFVIENLDELSSYIIEWKFKHQNSQGYNRPAKRRVG